MASSRIDHESGIVEITASGSLGYEVGRRFVVAGSAAALRFGYGQTWPDWCLRLVDPLPPWRGQTSGAPNHQLAEERLLEQLRSCELHPSLIEPPARAAA
jgi:hypothetical protein